MATANVYGANRGQQPQSPAEVAQDQLRALKLGLDLQTYQIYKRAPADWTNQHKAQFDPATGKFNIPNMVPGALQSNAGAPVTGPGGFILAAGSTPDKPIDLSTLDLVESPSEKWQREHASDALPGAPAPTAPSPAMTPQSAAATAADLRTHPGWRTPASPSTAGFDALNAKYAAQNTFLPPYLQGGQQGSPPNTNAPQPGAVAPGMPAMTQPVAPTNPFGIIEKSPIPLPAYLRNRQRKPGIMAYG